MITMRKEIQAVLGDVPGVETVDTASVGSLKVTITYDTGGTDEASSREFTLTVVHNPIEADGRPHLLIAQDDAADDLAPHSCTLPDDWPRDYPRNILCADQRRSRNARQQDSPYLNFSVMIDGGACTTSKDSLEVDFVNTCDRWAMTSTIWSM